MKFPKFSDLRGMANELAGDPRYRRLGTSIRKAAIAQSCVSDLAQAETCCAALRQLLPSPRKKGTLERSATENALLMTAVLLYARATSTSGAHGERGSINIASKLEVDQLADHEKLLAVRNRVVAHVYSQEPVADDIWHDDQMFLVDTGHGWKPGVATNSVQFHKTTFERLVRQIPIASAIVIQIFYKHTDAFTDIMNASPIPLEIFEKYSFDPVARFGGPNQVAQALAGIQGGSVSVLS